MSEHRTEHRAIPPAGLATFGLTDTDAERLLDIAESAIRAGLDRRAGPDLDEVSLPDALTRPIGAFVTLHVAGELNGCIGHIVPSTGIARTIAELAVKSAFGDPRLPELRPADLPHLDIEISLLTELTEVPAHTRDELIGRLRPHVDGLVLSSDGRSAIFLPTVWEQLPDPEVFIGRLMVKAGLPPTTWPHDMRADVFTTACFERPATGG